MSLQGRGLQLEKDEETELAGWKWGKKRKSIWESGGNKQIFLPPFLLLLLFFPEGLGANPGKAGIGQGLAGGTKGNASASKEEGGLARRCFRISLAQCDLLSHHGTCHLIRSPLGHKTPDASLITSMSLLYDRAPGCCGRRVGLEETQAERHRSQGSFLGNAGELAATH